MVVLGVDVGVTTRLAIITASEDDAGRVLHTSTATAEILDEVLLLLAPTVDEVVVERALPYGASRLGRELERIMRLIDLRCPNAHWVSAAQWKTSEFAKRPAPRGVTQHERDAVRLSLWWVDRNLTSV